MITRNINDDNTLAYLFRNQTKKTEATDKKLSEAEERLDGDIDDLDTRITDLGTTLGGRIDGLSTRIDNLDPDDIGAMWEWELIWENASPNATFAAQTVSLDLTQYNFVIIQFLMAAVDGPTSEQYGLGTAFTAVGESIRTIMFWASHATNRVGSRRATVTTTGIEFSKGGWNGGEHNGFTVPYKIYGIKGLVTS